MSTSFPRFRLYANDGTTLVYEFEYVTNWGNGPFQDPQSFVEHTSLRGQGSHVSLGSLSSWDFSLEFILLADNYEDLVAKIKGVSDTIVFGTEYILKIDLTSGGSTKDMKLKRLSPVLFAITNKTKVVRSQRCEITFKVESWT